MTKKTIEVKALMSIKHGGKWRIPGTPSGVFDVGEERAAQMLELGQVEPVVTGPKSDLPEDLPKRAVFIELGFETLDQIREAEDLTALPGIGEATADAIAEYLGEDAEGDGD